MLVICEMKQKNMLSFSVEPVVRDTFLLRRFFYLSLTHAPIFHRSMLRILWMQRNIRCIIVSTFKMIAISSAHSASMLSVVKPKQTTVSAAALISCELRPYAISRYLQAHPPKPPVDSTDI